jgi:hypothetical protein
MSDRGEQIQSVLAAHRDVMADEVEPLIETGNYTAAQVRFNELRSELLLSLRG